MAVGVVTGTYRKLQGVWKNYAQNLWKQGKNSARWPLTDGSSFKSVRGWHQHATGHDISCPYKGRRWRHKVAATTGCAAGG